MYYGFQEIVAQHGHWSSYVWRRDLNAPNILLNDSFVSAGGFDEKRLGPVNHV